MAKTSSSLPAGGNLFHNTLLGLNDGDFQHLTMLEKENLELISNKQNSLILDGTGTKYPTVDAVNAGINASTTPDATTLIKGKIKLSGDLSGTADTPTVPGLLTKQNTLVSGVNIKTIEGQNLIGSGNIDLTKSDVGLNNVDNTSDLNKPISATTQTALNLKQDLSEKNQINGYAGLGSDGKIISSQIPAIAITDTFIVNSQSAMLALSTAEQGDVAIRTDINKTFILQNNPYSTLSNWKELLSPTDSVTSVFGRQGVVVAVNGDYTTALVPETSDKNYQTDNQKLFNDATSSIQTQLNARALDSNVVHKTGTEIITGPKTFNNTSSTSAMLNASVSGTGTMAASIEVSSPTAVGLQIVKSSGIHALDILGAGSGSGSLINLENTGSTTNRLIRGVNTSGVEIFTVSHLADVTANKYIKTGGTSSQFLMADGSVNSGIFADNSTGAVQGFAVTNNGNGTVNIASGIAYLKATNDPYAPLGRYTIPAVTNLALTDNANNFILVDYNGGSPALTVTTNTATINTETNSLAIVISRVGNTLDWLSLVGQNVDANGKLRVRFLNQEGIRRANGAGLGFINRNLTLTAGVLFSGLIKINSPAFNTASPDTFTQVYNNGAVWTRTTGQTQVNNTQYNNAGVLTNLGNNDYRTDYIYLLPNNPSKLYLVLGTTSYTSITAARTAPIPSQLPSELQSLGLLVGRSIIQRLGAAITETSSAFDVVFADSSVPNHNDLAGIQGGAPGDYQHLTTAEKTIAINAVQGTGAVGQVGFWTGAKTQSGDNGLFWDNTNKRLGIGTASPLFKTHLLTGNNDGLKIESSNSGFIEISKTSGSRWRLQNDFNAANTLELLYGNNVTPAASFLAISNNGNVGIGTVSPSSKLEVNSGDIKVSQTIPTPSTTGFGITFRNFFNSNNYDAQIVTRTNAGGAATSGLLFRTGYFNGSVPTQADRMYIDAESGNICINTVTDNGVDKLQVNGTISTTGIALKETSSNEDAIFTALPNGSNGSVYTPNVSTFGGYAVIESFKNTGGDFGVQRGTVFTGGNKGKMYVRALDSGVWTAWVEK